MAEVRFSSLAETDIEDISLYYLKYSVNSARKFLKDLMSKFKMLAENPKIGRAHDDFFLNLRSFPYKRLCDLLFSGRERRGNLPRSSRSERY